MSVNLSAAPRARRMPSAALAASILLSPAIAAACACGCGIFDVGGPTGLMNTSTESDLSVFFRYDYMDQNQNWEGTHKAPASNNSDKKLQTSFYTPGISWRANLDWSFEAELPVYARHLTTTDDGTVFGRAGSIYDGKITDVGDLQIAATYTGLQPNLQTGLTFGVKLPTGNYTGPNGPRGGAELDRDSLPGTGSTDLIFGAYHYGALTEDGRAGYYVQGRAQLPTLVQGGYRPGSEFDAAAGLDYTFDDVGPFRRVTPVLSVLNSFRLRDSGPAADRANSGYERVFISPGVEVRFNQFRVYGDIEVPVYQHTNAGSVAADGTAGQMVASTLFKLQVSYDF